LKYFQGGARNLDNNNLLKKPTQNKDHPLRNKPNLAISNKGKFLKTKKNKILKYFHGVARNLDNNNYCLKQYCEFVFLGIWRLWRVFSTQNKALSTSRPGFMFYFFTLFCRRVAETRPNSF